MHGIRRSRSQEQKRAASDEGEDANQRLGGVAEEVGFFSGFPSHLGQDGCASLGIISCTAWQWIKVRGDKTLMMPLPGAALPDQKRGPEVEGGVSPATRFSVWYLHGAV